jgi:hypothetical protein
MLCLATRARGAFYASSQFLSNTRRYASRVKSTKEKTEEQGKLLHCHKCKHLISRKIIPIRCRYNFSGNQVLTHEGMDSVGERGK